MEWERMEPCEKSDGFQHDSVNDFQNVTFKYCINLRKYHFELTRKRVREALFKVFKILAGTGFKHIELRLKADRPRRSAA